METLLLFIIGVAFFLIGICWFEVSYEAMVERAVNEERRRMRRLR